MKGICGNLRHQDYIHRMRKIQPQIKLYIIYDRRYGTSSRHYLRISINLSDLQRGYYFFVINMIHYFARQSTSGIYDRIYGLYSVGGGLWAL